MPKQNAPEIFIMVGTGGVGKTSVSAALAYSMATKGKKTLVMTIDPSQRLKTTLNLDKQDFQEILSADFKNGGQLFACIIDAKKTFDEFVLRTSENEQQVKKLFENGIYQQLSTQLAQSQDFTSLEKLLFFIEEDKYDVIVLDTPPSQHTIDFLHSPQKLGALLDEKVMSWISDETENKSFVGRIINSGTKRVFGILEQLTGSMFLKQLRQFFAVIQNQHRIIKDRILKTEKILLDPATTYILVSAHDLVKIKESKYLVSELNKMHIKMERLILNRFFPEWLLLDNPTRPVNAELESLSQEFATFYRNRQATQKLWSSSGFTKQIYLPDLPDNISDLEGVKKLSIIINNYENFF